MRTKTFLRIFLAFAIIFFTSFLPEFFPSFFGDWDCQGGYWNGSMYMGCRIGGSHTSAHHYGFRHWILIAFGVVMFIANIVSVIIGNEEK